jgi:hypothetical protein
MALQNARKLPGFSGMVTLSTASRCSPISVRSEMWRRRSKLVFAPLSHRHQRLALHPGAPTYFLSPASASAPAGSAIERVSSKMSLIAAQISSVLR